MILDGEVAMLQAQVERLQEQLTESDHDRIANIARLTGQVATLQEQWLSKHNALVEAYASLRKSDAQRDELQRLLTACEEERDFLDLCATERRRQKDAAEDRVRVLEEALRTARLNMKPNAIWALDKVDAALASTPPAETPAASDAESPPDGYEFARMDAERDRLRAELADTRAQLAKVRRDRDEMIRVHDEVEAERDAAQAEAAAMREALAMLIDAAHYVAGSAQLNATPSFRDHLMRAAAKGTSALDGTAGRDLAARVPLWRELELATRDDESKGDLSNWVGDVMARLAALGKESK